METKNKWGQILFSAGYILLGGLLIWRPDDSAKVIGLGIGIGALLYGLLHLLRYWRSRRADAADNSELFPGITLAALGLFCLITPQTVLSFLPFLLGLALLVDAIGKLQRAFMYRRLELDRWWIVLVLGVTLLALGIALLFNPFSAVRMTILFFGVCLLADGLLDILSLMMLR